GRPPVRPVLPTARRHDRHDRHGLCSTSTGEDRTAREEQPMTALKTTVDMFDLRMSEKARPLYEAVTRFIAEEVEPHTEEFFRLGEGRAERWGYGEGQLELLESIKDRAKQQGLWNFFLPDAETGEGLSNLDYAYI